MEKLQSTGCYQVDEATLKAIQETFSAGYLDDSATKNVFMIFINKIIM